MLGSRMICICYVRMCSGLTNSLPISLNNRIPYYHEMAQETRDNLQLVGKMRKFEEIYFDEKCGQRKGIIVTFVQMVGNVFRFHINIIGKCHNRS